MKIRPPLGVGWEITLACDARCIHCGSAAGKAREKELTTREALQLVDELADVDVKFVILLGGEPLVRKDWADIAKRIRDNGMELGLITNGNLLNDKVANLLERLEPADVSISMDGDKHVHEQIRRVPNIYDHDINALKLLCEREIVASIITTVIKLNYSPSILDHLLNLVDRFELVAWKIQIAHLCGRMKEDYMISKEDLYNLSKWIAKRIKEGHKNIILGNNIGYYSSLESTLRQGYSWLGCPAGIWNCGITSNGGVKGCLGIPDYLTEGYIRERNFKDIWFDEEKFKFNRKFDPSHLQGICAGCDFGNLCKGGCRAFNIPSGKINEYSYCLYRYEEQLQK